MKKLVTNRRNRVALLIPTIIATGLFTVGAANADAGWFGKDRHDRAEHHYERMEHLADMLDMTAEQEAQLKQILENAKQSGGDDRATQREMRKGMMSVSPDDPEFMSKVEQQADAMATRMKARMVEFAKVRQQVYGILTDEQKQKMQKMMEKRMKKMEERWEDD